MGDNVSASAELPDWPEWRVDVETDRVGMAVTDTWVCGFARIEHSALVITRGRLVVPRQPRVIPTDLELRQEPRPHPDNPLAAWTIIPMGRFRLARISYIGKDD
jgi:hypothetical protein